MLMSTISLNREQSIALVEHEYFGRVKTPDLEGLLALFTDDARMTVYHGDGAPDVFAAKPDAQAGEVPLTGYFGYVFGNFTVDYAGFNHTFDVEAQSHACTFQVILSPKPGSEAESAGPQTYNNCNFFTYRDGKIADIIIYYVNPNA